MSTLYVITLNVIFVWWDVILVIFTDCLNLGSNTLWRWWLRCVWHEGLDFVIKLVSFKEGKYF